MGRKRKMTADRTATDLRRKRTTETKAEATKAETKTSRARAIITIIITSRAVRITRAHSSRARRTTIKARTKKTKRATRTVRR